MSGDTIFALASGAGRAGVAVIRLSGDAAGTALSGLSGGPLPAPRRMTRVRLADPCDGALLDNGLAVWFPGPASYTGEDVVELHVHGGRAVIGGVLAALGRCDGLRPAEAGEFTRRAFLAGKLDLTEAEGLGDLVDAETEAQRDQALRQMGGGLSDLYEGWRARLVAAMAHLEATIDFSDEELPDGLDTGARAEVAGLRDEIARHLADGHRGERLREGFRLAIIGAPNSGKSSLLNRLARREAAIVSATAGTTRDVIEVHLDLGGFPLVVADTAGLRETADDIESEGVRRARQRAEEADLRLAVIDVADWPEIDGGTAALIDADTLVVVNKVDVAAPDAPLDWEGRPVRAISALRGDGLDGLLETLAGMLAERAPRNDAPVLTRARHRSALEQCGEALDRFLAGGAAEMQAEDLRLAARALGRITGRVDVEDLLDVIFRDFCIGK